MADLKEVVITAPKPLKSYFDFDKGRNVLFTAGYTQAQTDSINAILRECNLQGVSLRTQIGYLLATAYHECYNPKTPNTRITPMREFGGEAYLKDKKYYPYVGMGFSQLTWEENYKKESIRLDIDLINNPELMLQIPIAANSHVYCITNGTYTGAKLSKYVNANKTDFPNARRTVNGTDKAELIAGYASEFTKCIIIQ